jgi:hypothetical protein
MAHAPVEEDVAILAARIEQQDAAIAQLHGQVREASKLITELADQNAQLIAHAGRARTPERDRARRRRLGTAGRHFAGPGAGAYLILDDEIRPDPVRQLRLHRDADESGRKRGMLSEDANKAVTGLATAMRYFLYGLLAIGAAACAVLIYQGS